MTSIRESAQLALTCFSELVVVCIELTSGTGLWFYSDIFCSSCLYTVSLIPRLVTSDFNVCVKPMNEEIVVYIENRL